MFDTLPVDDESHTLTHTERTPPQKERLSLSYVMRVKLG